MSKSPLLFPLPGILFSLALVALIFFIIQRESAPIAETSKARLMLEPPSGESVSGSIPWYRTEELSPIGSAAILSKDQRWQNPSAI